MGEDQFSGSEKRKYSRLKDAVFISGNLTSSNSTSSNPGEFKAFSRDISAGGLMFETEKDIPQDMRLDLEIYQPVCPRKIIFFSSFANAKVIWSRKIDKDHFEEGENKYRVGVEFLEINGEDRKRIDTYVKKLY